MSDNKEAIYAKKSLRELELELTIFTKDYKSCAIPRRIHWLLEHMTFLEQMITEKRKR